MSDTERILANTLYRAAADVASKVISIAFYVVMARELGERGFGVFVFGISLAALLTVLAGFGQDPVLTREVARDRSRLDDFADVFVLKLVLALPVVAIATAVAWAAGLGEDKLAVVALLGVALVAELLTNTCFAIYQAYERLGFVPVVIIAQRVFTAAVGIAALLAGAGVVAVSAIYLAGAALALVVAVMLLFRRVARPRLRVRVHTWWPFMRLALPVGVGLVLQVVLFRVDAAILAALEPERVVGDYGAAYRLFEATLFVSWAVAVAVYPVLARLTMLTEPTVRRVFEQALKLTVAPTLPLAVGAALLANPIVRLVYGAEFEEAGLALALLAPAILLYSLAFVAAAMLVAQNRQRPVAIVYGVVAALNVAGNFALIPFYSLNGSALVTTLSELLLAGSFLALARRLTGGLDWARIVAGPAVATALVAAVALVLRDSPGLAVAIAALVYVVALAAFERLRYPEDAHAIASFLRRGGRTGVEPA